MAFFSLFLHVLESSQTSLILCQALLLHPEFSSLGALASTCEASCDESSSYTLCLRYDLHDLAVEASTMHACLDSRISLDSPPVSQCQNVFSLQGVSASIGSSNFFLCVLNGFLQLLVIRINRIDASRLSRIVELWFLDSPLLLFLSLSCF